MLVAARYLVQYVPVAIADRFIWYNLTYGCH